VLEQNFIGWWQLFNGRMTALWAEHQDAHLHRIKKHTKKCNGLAWSIDVISTLWKEWFKLWKDHNKVIHGHDSSSWAEALQHEAEAKLKAIYELRNMCLPSDQDLLLDSVEEHLLKSTNSIRNWLQTF